LNLKLIYFTINLTVQYILTI